MVSGLHYLVTLSSVMGIAIDLCYQTRVLEALYHLCFFFALEKYCTKKTCRDLSTLFLSLCV